MKYFLIVMLISTALYAQSDSSLQSACAQEGFACGSCEEPLQSGFNDILNGITEQDLSSDHWGNLKDEIEDKGANIQFKNPMPSYESVLEDIVDLMRSNTPGGNLNYVVIGESESLQQTSVKDGKMNPRVMLKSPNSELMVTFSTDPTLPGYNSIEVMRWNGKEARYEFQEINFGDQGEPPHIDLSGKKCAECHKSPSMRPNWDTYRAWAGVVPSRDDMLEMDYDENAEKFKDPMQPDGRAYLSFLDQVAAAKDNPTDPRSQRLAMLDIPFDEEEQMESYLEDFRNQNGREPTNQEKVSLIKQRVEEDGFYRIRHHPDYTNSDDTRRNFDDKTAEAAGPSQFAFDQMLAQNMCRITQTLKDNPDFEKFKYGLVSMMKCGTANTFEGAEQVLPESFLQRAVSYQATTQGSTMTEIEPDIRSSLSSDNSPKKMYDLLLEDTNRSHARANGFKHDRHGNLLQKYLTGVEGIDETNASEQARYYSQDVFTPQQRRYNAGLEYHAIGDPRGVAGVDENAAERIANLRLFLEPFDVNVEHWSMVNGRDTAYNSYSFSDQFPLLEEEKLFNDIYEEVRQELKQSGQKVDVCKELARRSLTALEQEDPIINPEEERNGYLDQLCLNVQAIPSDQDVGGMVNMGQDLQLNVLNEQARSMMQACITCHRNGPFPPKFEGLVNFIDNNDAGEFIEFLNSDNGDQKYIDRFMDKLAVHGPTVMGGAMPPMDWEDNDKFAEDFGVDPLNIQNERRRMLGLYLYALSKSENEDIDIRNMCSTNRQGRTSTNNQERTTVNEVEGSTGSDAVEN